MVFNGYDGFFANFGKGKGQAAFSKIQLSSKPEIVASEKISAIILKTDHFSIIFLYLSQNYDKDFVYKILDSWIQSDIPTAVLGDINENLFETSMFEKFMKTIEKMKIFEQTNLALKSNKILVWLDMKQNE